MSNKTTHIVLSQPHTHAGIEYASGDTLELRAAQAAVLIEQHNARVASSEEIKQYKKVQQND